MPFGFQHIFRGRTSKPTWLLKISMSRWCTYQKWWFSIAKLPSGSDPRNSTDGWQAKDVETAAAISFLHGCALALQHHCMMWCITPVMIRFSFDLEGWPLNVDHTSNVCWQATERLDWMIWADHLFHTHPSINNGVLLAFSELNLDHSPNFEPIHSKSLKTWANEALFDQYY